MSGVIKIRHFYINLFNKASTILLKMKGLLYIMVKSVRQGLFSLYVIFPVLD